MTDSAFHVRCARLLNVVGCLVAAQTHVTAQSTHQIPQIPFRPHSIASDLQSDNRYGQLPLSFEPNRGQAVADIRYIVRGPGYSLALTRTEARFALRSSRSRGTQIGHEGRGLAPSFSGPPAMLSMRLVGASRSASLTGQSRLPGRVNYLVGSDAKAWHTDIPTFRTVRCQGAYPGIDLVYYGNQRQLEYDFVVAPRADPGRISLEFQGVRRMFVDKHGDLVAPMKLGTVRWHKPVVYQQTNGRRHTINGRFVLKGRGSVGFVVARYDVTRPLVIDPVFAYATYLGGGANDNGTGIALDSSGNAYVTGTTNSLDFAGATNPPGLLSGFVSKLDPTGTTLLYSTYINGAYPQGIAVDGNGIAYLTGYTDGVNFPFIGAAQSVYGGKIDAFLMTLNTAGNQLLYSTVLGGSDFDTGRSVALGPDGTAYITGYTFSTNFPTRSPFQGANAGGQDAFVARINTALTGPSSLLYSTYLGGVADDYGYSIAVDGQGRYFVAGRTASTNFPTQAAYQPNLVGVTAAFVTAAAADGSRPFYSSFLGGSSADSGFGIAVDAADNAYITGFAQSADFPVRAPSQPAGGGVDAFAAKIDCKLAGNASLIYSTRIGGPNEDVAYAIAADVWGNAYVTGYTYNAPPPTPASIFLVKIGAQGGKFTYVGILGGSGSSSTTAIAVDPLGCAFLTGTTASSDFPVTPGAVQTSKPGAPSTQDAFVVRMPTFTKIDLNGDAVPDLLFQYTDGTLGYWTLAGDHLLNYGRLSPINPGAPWKLVATADLNGDNNTDLIFQNSDTGDIWYWLMNGITETSYGPMNPVNIGPNWRVAGAADFNRDGYPDILFQHVLNGSLYVWYMKGTTMIGGSYMNPNSLGPYWNVVAVGDVNNDGQADVVFQHGLNGSIYVWYAHGNTFIGGGFTNPVDPGSGWNVVGLTDINGDGRQELLFQNANSGDIAYWVLNGLNLVRVGTPTPSNPGGAMWQLSGIR